MKVKSSTVFTFEKYAILHLRWRKKFQYKNSSTLWKTFLFNDANYMPQFWKTPDMKEDYSLAPGMPTAVKQWVKVNENNWNSSIAIALQILQIHGSGWCRHSLLWDNDLLEKEWQCTITCQGAFL